jgi:hypothetical protein
MTLVFHGSALAWASYIGARLLFGFGVVLAALAVTEAREAFAALGDDDNQGADWGSEHLHNETGL